MFSKWAGRYHHCGVRNTTLAAMNSTVSNESQCVCVPTASVWFMETPLAALGLIWITTSIISVDIINMRHMHLTYLDYYLF